MGTRGTLTDASTPEAVRLGAERSRVQISPPRLGESPLGKRAFGISGLKSGYRGEMAVLAKRAGCSEPATRPRSDYGATVARDRAAHRIVIFQDTLERDFGSDPDLLARQVERTLRHEVAHHLGYGEPGVAALGL